MNPIAGIGGPVALKGSDDELAQKAKSVGGISPAPSRTVQTLDEIARANIDLVILTYPNSMGENEALNAATTLLYLATFETKRLLKIQNAPRET